jgi:uncharacterized membrane protein
MNSLEWNPSFSPVVSALIVLAAGAYFFLIERKVRARHGRFTAWILLLPKIVLVTLLIAALLDPDLKIHEGNTTPARVLVLQDISSSMDLKDDGKRSDRADALIRSLESSAPASVRFEVLPFDTTLHAVGYVPKPGVERGTDLAAVLETLATNPKLSDADGAIVVTDGGDETVQLAQMPTVPLALIGVGSSPDDWNDIGISAATAPATVEEKSEFDLQANIDAQPDTPGPLNALKVSLDEEHDHKWDEIKSQTIDLTSRHAAASFHVTVSETGTLRYRVRLPQLPAELTYANNTRIVTVQVQPRALHVLYFTDELGVDYKYLRNELASDPGVLFTAMYRVMEDQFTVQGDRTGYQDLATGFPSKEDVLRRYDCIILGSFPASELNDAQTQALVKFVSDGNALVFLGGDQSFGRGGYAASKLAPLIPWSIADQEPDLATGTFPVSMAPSAAAVDFTAGLREDISAAGGITLDSLNQPGGLRPGAVSLLEAALTSHSEPVVAWQHYGKGQVLGIATNTMWKWAAAGGPARDLYGKFWRQSVRGLTQKFEGGSLLGIKWDQPQYQPGEAANLDIELRGASDAGPIRLVGTLHGPAGDHDVDLTPVTGQSGRYTAKITFGGRGDYVFRLTAYTGGSVAESYERAVPVEPLLEEGASPELKEAYLRDIATRAHGIYTDEKHLDPVTAFLRQQVMAEQPAVAVPLANFWNIFPVVAILILVIEWVIRRRHNLI